MMTVIQTKDLSRVKQILHEPDLYSKITEDIVVTPDEDAVLSRKGNIYFEVAEGGKSRGLVIFSMECSDWHSLHLCLKDMTVRGQYQAALLCIDLARINGVRRIITAAPAANKALLRMLSWSTFSRMPAFLANLFYNPVFKTPAVFYAQTN